MDDTNSIISKRVPKPSGKLAFTIVRSSSFSSTYFPENILENKPKDQTSRWSSDSNTPPQFLVLKLQRVSVIDSITFGKFEKTHVCNLKKFKIFGGLTEENMSELVESGLKNDSCPETFPLKHEVNGYSYPCRFIKIVPLQSWGPSFNFSIWYVELRGIDDYEFVQPCITRFHNFQEREAIRVCLKHLRNHNYLEAFESLQKKTKVQLEHPMMSQLHEMLVLKGDFAASEKFLEQCSESQLFHNFISQQDYKAVWTQLSSEQEAFEPERNEQADPIKPSMRGGHQMCIDVESENIYLFGGWNGASDLADFWVYQIPTGQWTLLSKNTENEGGPGPRSCHKMCILNRQIFTLGRYLDSQYRPHQSQMKGDFYVYDIESNKWTQITDDTAAMGGPSLIFDFQMCADEEKHVLYVFGGRILTGNTGVSETLNAGPNLYSVVLPGSGGGGGNVVPMNEDNAFVPIQNVENSNNRGDAAEGEGHNNSHSGLPGASPSSANSELLYSGLYAYLVPTNTWTLLRSDVAAQVKTKETIRSRVGHSMLFHPGLRKLFVLAGQRQKEYLNDFLVIDVDKDEVQVISDGSKSASLTNPSTGFTQRATIDAQLNEIYVFSGLSKDKDKRDDSVQNSFWVFDINRKAWSCVYRSDKLPETLLNAGLSQEPCPRFAHQIVYDYKNKIHYLFGGNHGRTKDSKTRLDDFWKLCLIRPVKDDVLRQCKFMLRRHQFEELASRDTREALLYLQTSLSELVNHDDPAQAKEFQKLTFLLFSTDEDDGEDLRILEHEDPTSEAAQTDQKILKRSRIFDKLVRYFPEDMTQPKLNLVDLLAL